MMMTPQERLRAFRARNVEYVRLGHNRLAAARFLVEAAGPLRGPALDVGTGKGLLAMELARQGLEVLSIDVHDQERGLARLLADRAGLASQITFEEGIAAKLPYADGRFGCVAMMDVLHHLAEPGLALCEMARVVAVGGTLVIADFDEQGFELVSRVHRAEGREHSRAGTTIAEGALTLEKLGLVPLRRTKGWHHDAAVLRREEMRPS